MPRNVTLSKLTANNTSMYILLPAALRKRLCWRDGDTVAMREFGDKIVIERIPAERFAILNSSAEEAL